GNSRSLALLRTGRGSSVNGRSRVYVTARFEPFDTATSALATTWFSVRRRVPRPRHRPTRGSTTPVVDTIGSVGRLSTPSTVAVSGYGNARRISSRVD